VGVPSSDAQGIRIRGAERLPGTAYLVVGESLEGGGPVAGIVEFGALVPFRRIEHPFERGCQLRDLAGIPGTDGFLVCVANDSESGPGRAWLASVRLDLPGQSLVVLDRHPLLPGDELPEGVACVGRGTSASVVVGLPGAGAAPARLYIGEFEAGRSIQWADDVPEVRAPLDGAGVEPALVRDCEALYADGEGSIWSLATWTTPHGGVGGSALYRVGRLDGNLALQRADGAAAWVGIGIHVDAVARRAAGPGAMVFGPGRAAMDLQVRRAPE
jgi:hypothetical protein